MGRGPGESAFTPLSCSGLDNTALEPEILQLDVLGGIYVIVLGVRSYIGKIRVADSLTGYQFEPVMKALAI